MSLESMRRGFVGGTSLSLFVIKEFGLEKHGKVTCEFLRYYLEVEEEMLSRVPDWLEWAFIIFQDYHDSAVVYLDILDDMVEIQQPSKCQWYWENA